MKRDDEGEVAKVMFNEALDSLELQEDIDEATRDMWQMNQALRDSIQAIIEDKETYPDTMAAIRMSLQEFVSAVSSMIEGAIGEIEEGVEKVTKGEGSVKYPSTDYAYTPDLEDPASWRFRVTKAGEPEQRLVQAAVVALSESFNKKVQIPEDALPGMVKHINLEWLKAHPGKEKDLPEVLIMKENPMTPEEKKAHEEALSKAMKEKDDELEKVNADLTIAKAIGDLNDLEKAHYTTLDEEGQTAFLTASPEVRKSTLDNIAAEDAVVYTDTQGAEYKKSDDDRLVQMAKDRDEDRKLAKADREKSETLELQKRADTELNHLPGEQAVKVAVLKAIDTIEDEEVKKSAKALLKAGNDGLEKAFTEVGSRGEGFKKASDELDALAKKYAADNKVEYLKAYDEVLKTEDGKRLYEQTLPQAQG